MHIQRPSIVHSGAKASCSENTRRGCLKAMLGSTLLAFLPTSGTRANAPLRLIIPTEAGGQMDVLARSIANVMTGSMERAVVVENRGGAAGQIAARTVAQSRGDANVVLMASMGIMSISPHLYKNLSYDVARDFIPLALAANAPSAMMVNPSAVPARTVDEFVTWVRQRSSPLPYASFGPGSVSNIATEMFADKLNVTLTQIPYRSPSQLQTDLLAGDVPLYIDTPARFLEIIRAKQLRALAVTTLQRCRALPDVPTLDESGYAGFNFANWYGFYSPAGVDAGTAEHLRRALAKAVSSDAVVRQFEPLGLDIPPGPTDFASFSDAELQRWKSFISAQGIHIDPT